MGKKRNYATSFLKYILEYHEPKKKYVSNTKEKSIITFSYCQYLFYPK